MNDVKIIVSIERAINVPVRSDALKKTEVKADTDEYDDSSLVRPFVEVRKLCFFRHANLKDLDTQMENAASPSTLYGHEQSLPEHYTLPEQHQQSCSPCHLASSPLSLSNFSHLC